MCTGCESKISLQLNESTDGTTMLKKKHDPEKKKDIFLYRIIRAHFVNRGSFISMAIRLFNSSST